MTTAEKVLYLQIRDSGANLNCFRPLCDKCKELANVTVKSYPDILDMTTKLVESRAVPVLATWKMKSFCGVL